MKKIFGILLVLSSILTKAQLTCTNFDINDFVLNGSAVITNINEASLTPALGNKYGTLWSDQKILFSEDFTLNTELYLGTNNGGADGITFVLQPLSSNAGSMGGGIGYEGVTPSLSIEFDTWSNPGSDPMNNDHIAIIKNGQPYSLAAHSEFIPPIDVGNIEDGNWHPALIEWTASTQRLKLTFDGNMLFDEMIDFSAIFPGMDSVFWGFTAATGAASNLQQVKINNYCVTLDSAIPQIAINSTLDYCSKNSCEIIAPSISIARPEAIIEGAKVYFTANYVQGEDVLHFTPNFGITGNFDSLTGVLSLGGSATVANYQQVLQTVCYQNSATFPTIGSRNVSFVIGDALFNPDNHHFYRHINSANPVLWSEARSNAENTDYFGLPGYLVTITDQKENNFINAVINSQSWLGATDELVEGEWRWVTGCEGEEEGGLGLLFSLQQINAKGIPVNGSYNNWACVEPNNCCGGENYLHMIAPNNILCGNFGEWNDYPDTGVPYAGAPPVYNYIIEYGCSDDALYNNLSASTIINVGNEIIPTFNLVTQICSGAPLVNFPTLSNEGIAGAWSPSPDNTKTTTYTFQPDGGQCALSTTMTISVIPIVTPTGVAVQDFCSPATIADLMATGNNIQWYDASVGGTLLSPSTSLIDGTTYYASETNSSCESVDRFAVTVIIHSVETPTGAVDQTFCNLATVADLQAVGNNIQWYTVPMGGTLLDTSTSLSNGLTYYAAQTEDGCESAVRMAVDVTIIPVSVPSGEPYQQFCASATLANIQIEGSNILWYDSATAGGVLSDATPLVDGTTYYASQTIDGCESSDRLPVTVSFYPNADEYQLNFPKYFTPNQDGYNDVWQIESNEHQEIISVQIYDRYGKLIKQLLQSAGWDGTFIGQKLPSTDYWFVVDCKVRDANCEMVNRRFSGHFSLKR